MTTANISGLAGLRFSVGSGIGSRCGVTRETQNTGLGSSGLLLRVDLVYEAAKATQKDDRAHQHEDDS